MSTETKQYLYTVNVRSSGDYTTEAGRWEVAYRGPRSEDAIAAAHDAATQPDVQVQIEVRRKRG